MEIQNIVQNKYVQVTGAILAFMFVAWLVTDSNASSDVATNVSTSDVVSETHKVSTEVDIEPMEITVEGKVPSNDENTNSNTGEI
tara:strand:+ start:1772 stop:2026 length:255 start_codon:yes stop_codon:yes gene_type:complete